MVLQHINNCVHKRMSGHVECSELLNKHPYFFYKTPSLSAQKIEAKAPAELIVSIPCFCAYRGYLGSGKIWALDSKKVGDQELVGSPILVLL